MEETEEKKNGEFFETWMKSQREFIENWTKNQKEFMDGWLEAAKKMQESFSFDGGKAGTSEKEILNMYNTWLNTMVNSSKLFTDQAMKMQESWKTTVEKQMSMNKELFKNFNVSSRQAAAQ